jgi:hypothetical protein
MSTRICRAHDADDVVPDRVCGHPMPCPDHPRGWQGVRLKTTPAMRSRKNTLFTLSEAARERLREMAEEQRRPASRVLEDLILAGRS